jgi:hypothetical protein
MLDVFKSDVFGIVSLTTAINKLPYAPSRLGAMGLFNKKGITTLTVGIESREGKIALLQTAARGTMPYVAPTKDRKVRTFPVPHIPLNDTVMADDVQGVRAFGSEDALEGVTEVVNDKLTSMRQLHELTHEWHRAGAIQGIVKDGDGTSTLFNLFTEFGITRDTVNFDMDSTSSASVNIQALATQVIRLIEDALGSATYNHIHAMCGDSFFDHLISHPSVKGAYEKWQVGTTGTPFTIAEVPRTGFTFAGITWENYRGSVGGTRFVPTDEAEFFPVGVQDLFIERYAPADFVETVNTVGKPTYAKQEELRFGKGIEIHTQSNPIVLCARPKVLVRGLDTGVYV